MEIEVTNDKNEKLRIVLRPMLAREVDQGFNKFVKSKSVEDDNKIEAFNDLLDYMDRIASRISGLSIEELGNLNSDDKSLIVKHVYDKITSKVDFLKPSQNQAGSAQEDTHKQSSS